MTVYNPFNHGEVDMKQMASEGQEHQAKSWAQPSREAMIREIEDLILSPYWQQLHPQLRGRWLDQLGELHRHPGSHARS